jgi:hypothetical protein
VGESGGGESKQEAWCPRLLKARGCRLPDRALVARRGASRDGAWTGKG